MPATKHIVAQLLWILDMRNTHLIPKTVLLYCCRVRHVGETTMYLKLCCIIAADLRHVQKQ